MNFFAVFSPTPGKPGMLSTESPIIPKKSITWIGFFTSNLFFTSSTPQISIPFPNLAGLYRKVESVTNWAKSLSGVTIYVNSPSFSAFFATVPMISSASYPLSSSILIPNCVKISWIIGTESRIGSGVESLFALYSSNISILSLDPPLSKTTEK